MNKTALLIIFLALFASSCGNSPRQSSDEADVSVETNQDTTATIQSEQNEIIPFALTKVRNAYVTYSAVNIKPAEDLRSSGYTLVCSRLEIWNDSAKTELLLRIDPSGIKNAHGATLLDQEEARFGYAWQIVQTPPEALLSRRDVLLLIMMDEQGNAFSDELYLYWDEETEQFIATNISSPEIGL